MRLIHKTAWVCLLFAAKLAMIAAIVALGGCSSTPPTPQWQIDASDSLRRATESYLEGRVKNIPVQVFEADMKRARESVSATGRPAQLGRIELAFCAAQVASLDAKALDQCAGFASVRNDAPLADLAYERHLHGRASPADVEALPEQHRAAAAQLASGSLKFETLAAMPDALSRLVAAAAALQAKQASPAIVNLAVETASQQGWRRPLLAWLGVQLKLAQAANDAPAATAIERRIQIASTTR